MADIMRATTPINNRNIIQPAKEHRDATALPFDFQDTTVIKQTTTQSEMLGQNNVLRENGSSATALFSMLKDPEVATSFLKNIFFLREIVGLMPLNNETQTEEMQQLLNRLILTPEEIPQEMKSQENIATIFKGDIFDTLRQLLSANGKSVAENIAEKLSQIPLAQLNNNGETVKQLAHQTNAPQNQTAGQPVLERQQLTQTEGQASVQTAGQPVMQGENQAVQQQTAPPQQPLENQGQMVQITTPDGEVIMVPQQNTIEGQLQQPTADGQPMTQPQQTEEQTFVQTTGQPEGQPVMQGEGQAVLQQTALPQQSVENQGQLVQFTTPDGDVVTIPQQYVAENPVAHQQPVTENNLSAVFFNALNNSGVEIEHALKDLQSGEVLVNNGVNPEKVVSQKDIQDSVINLLKAISSQENRTDVIDAVKNNLLFLKSEFPENSDYSLKLSDLSQKLEALMKGEIPKSEFSDIKSQVLELLDSLQNSVLYDDEMAKTAALAKYNLSRYNSNENLITEAFSKLLENVPDKDLQTKLTNDLVKYLEASQSERTAEGSRTMSALAEILEKQSENMEAKMLNSESIDKIVHGLLSSPSNFTPLLHYVIPVDNGQAQAMAEIWINPNGEEDVEGGTNSGKKMTHMLVVFEIDGIGKFETELYAEDKNITLSVLCPKEHLSDFKGVNADIRRACESTGYRFRSIEIGEFKESRSLIDVFRSLPARRSGINVTI